MKQSSVMGFVLFIGLAGCAAAWILLPTLQGPVQAVESAAAVPIERARRLLHQYDARLPYQSAVIDELRASGASLEDPDNLSEESLDEYQQIHERLWAAFQPMQWGERPMQARANYGATQQQMRQGAEDRLTLLSQNDALLNEASSAIDEALSVASGAATGRDLSEALRLKSIILFYQGMAESTRASVAREELAPLRMELATLADEADDLTGSITLTDKSGIAADIEKAKAEADAAKRAVAEHQQVLAGLDRSLADIRQRIASLDAKRAQAKANLERLEIQGLDFSLENAADAYASEYLNAARAYREAHRQIHNLTTGYFPRARIDASGDFLTGRYLEDGSPFNLTIERGLNHLEHERSVASKVLGEREHALREWRTASDRLDSLRANFATEESNARNRLAEIRTEADNLLDALDSAESTALNLEDAALAKFDQAARAAGDAASAAARWVSDAQQRTQSMPMQSQDRSAFKPRSDDRWIGGFILAQAADARLARAWIFQSRYTSATQNAVLLDRLVSLTGLDASLVAAERDAANDAREAGVEEVKLAMADLERAHRDAEGHWTLVAQAGSTQYLMTLFGDSSYLPDTIATYRKAVESREDLPAAQPIVSRLKALETR